MYKDKVHNDTCTSKWVSQTSLCKQASWQILQYNIPKEDSYRRNNPSKGPLRGGSFLKRDSDNYN